MTLHKSFTDMIVHALPIEVRSLLVEVGPSIMVGGGFCRDAISGAEPKDIDIFSRSKHAMNEAVDLFDWTEKYTSKVTANAHTFTHDEDGPDVQFITRVFLHDNYTTILSFDFSICQVGVWFDADKGWIGQCSEAFLEDLPAFKMRYTAPERDEDPGGSLLRMVKFVSRGYKISESDIARVVGRFVSKLEVDAPVWPMTEAEAIDTVKKAFRRIGYAGKQEVVLKMEIDDTVPF